MIILQPANTTKKQHASTRTLLKLGWCRTYIRQRWSVQRSTFVFEKSDHAGARHTEYLLVLAEAEYRMGDEEEAELLYKRILELDPTMMEAWLDWSYVLFNRGAVEEAVTMVYEALKTEPDCHQYHYRLVSYLYHLGKTKQAVEHLEMGLIAKL